MDLHVTTVTDCKGQNVLGKDTKVIVFWGVTLSNLVDGK
jgi:hypothetical protein